MKGFLIVFGREYFFLVESFGFFFLGSGGEGMRFRFIIGRGIWGFGVGIVLR